MFARLGVAGSNPEVRSRIGDFPAVMGTVAAATMADDILTEGPGQLRGLVVIGGNPAVALPDTPRAHEALGALDTLVCVDLFVNDTGTFADVVLPAATWLERDEVPVHTANQARRPHLEWTRAVVRPRGESREDWDILISLARACGKSPFGSALVDRALRMTGIGPAGIGRLAALRSPVRWGALRRADRGVQLDRSPLGTLRRRGTEHGDGKVRLAIPAFLDALRQHRPLRRPAGAALQLVSSVRPKETMNSWMHTGRAARRVPIARLHPADHAELGIGETVRLSRPDAPEHAVNVACVVDPGVRQGVVVLPFGWGHRAGAIGSGAAGPAGVNANVLVATDRLEPFTGQPLSNGRWVHVAPGDS